MVDWLTNDPVAARRFRAIDKQYEADRKAASNLPLAEKIKAYGQAHLVRAKAYQAFWDEVEATR